VDSNGILVAHPNIDLVLRRTDLSSLPQVQAALAASAEPAAQRRAEVKIARDLRGNRVLTTCQPVASLGWTVFLEQPLNEAFAPLYNAILRTALLEVIGLGLALLSSLILARRMVAPILALQSGAARIGAGSLEQAIHVRTGDELEVLADEFNRMSTRLRSSYTSLEKKVEEAERAAVNLQKANDQLVEAQDQLLRTEKLAVIGQLSAGVAHDLRNPLGAINNAIYYLKRRLGASEMAQSNPRIGQFLQVIEDEVAHSNQIITDLMGFARISSPSLSSANLGETIQDMLSSIEVRNNVRIVKRFEPELPEVLADPEQLRRVFINLTMNAQEAMPDGGELTISTRRVNGFAEAAFSDTGIGIPDENLKKVFDPLFTTKTKGTGLGLAVCQEIVTRHRGTIGVASKPGEGTTFTVRLPCQPLVEPGSDPRVVVAQGSKPRV
jgi:signal transduction histidine kinase